MRFFVQTNPAHAWLTALWLLVLPLNGYGQETPLQASDIFEQVEQRQDAIAGEVTQIQMEIIDNQGRTRERAMTVYAKQTEADRARSLLVFSEPADVRGMGLLTIETEAGDDQLLYLPALRRTQRIAGSKRGDRFAGSDFTYEDLGNHDAEDYRLTLQETRPDRWVIEAQPIDEDSPYTRILFEIDRERYTILKATYFNDEGTRWKELSTEGFSEVKPDIWRADRMQMKDVLDDRRTILTFVERRVVENLDDDLFTERQLKRGIR